MTDTTKTPKTLEVRVRDLMVASGCPRSTIMDAIAAGHLPRADWTTPGGHRRWGRRSLRKLAAFVRARGREVPAGWETAKRKRGALDCGCVRPAFCGMCAASDVL